MPVRGDTNENRIDLPDPGLGGIINHRTLDWDMELKIEELLHVYIQHVYRRWRWGSNPHLQKQPSDFSPHIPGLLDIWRKSPTLKRK